MKSLHVLRPITAFSSSNSLSCSTIFLKLTVARPSLEFTASSLTIPAPKSTHRSHTALRSQSRRNSRLGDRKEEEEEDSGAQIEDLRIPEHWLEPSKALEESEWLRVTLHKWLDDEYCPEATNVEISKVAAYSYYKSLKEKQTDLGEILLKMARELETISYQESFHGAFSSANAAVNLIAERIDQRG